jgi:hypothetical protein
VLVPGLAVVEDLDVTNAALDQAAGDEAAGGVVAGDGVIDAVEFFDVLRFVADVERFFGGGLHVGGEFVTGDACLQIELAGVLGEVVLVKGIEQGKLAGLRGSGERGQGVEIEDAWLGRADDGTLEEGGQPAVGEVFALEGGQTVGMGEHHVSRQVLSVAAEAVGEPGAEGWATSGDASGVHGVEALGVVVHAGGHGADEGDVIDYVSEVREELADFHAALAVLGEGPGGTEDLGGGLSEVVILDLTGEFLPVVFGEHGFGIKQIHLRGAAHHEEGDHGFGLAVVVGALGREVVAFITAQHGLHGGGEQPVLFQQRGQRERAQAKTIGVKKVTARAELGWGHNLEEVTLMRGGISQRESVWLGGEQGLGEGDELIEPRWESEMAADAGVALEVVDVLDFVGSEEVDDGWGGVPTGVCKGVGFGNEAVEDVPTERLNGEGEEEESIFAFEGHLKRALGGGGIVNVTVSK